jgi:hypothetical protein
MFTKSCSTFLAFVLCSASALAQAGDTWREFRSHHPYHTNVVALAPVNADGTRVLIVAEPASHVTVAALTALRPAALSRIASEKWQIGWDGWVKDLVITLPAMSDEDLRNTLGDVEQYVYGSTYRAAVIEMPERSSSLHPASANLHISAGELRSWAAGNAIKFSTIFGESPVRLIALLSGRAGGVYYSAPSGLVAWILPRKGALPAESDIRQFAVDSDLIVGAVASASRVAILARRRLLTQDELPPLRSETIKLLASVHNDSLAQSYARTYLLAGKYDDKHDWAPAYLSDELIDTEYGSLLNITDQLLKSWSESGTITYEHFPYPKPKSFPFGDKTLWDLVKVGDEGLTFNWNTRGAGYTVSGGDLAVFAVNRTGSLPVSYFAAEGSSMAGYERTAYDWFSSLHDPNLVRVVQYASLYQIFRAFRTPTSRQFPSRQPDVTPIGEALLKPLLRQDDLARIVVKSIPRAQKAAEGLRDAVNVLKEQCGEKSIKQLASMLASPDNSSLAVALKRKPSDTMTVEDQCLFGTALIARLVQSDNHMQHILMLETGRDLYEWKNQFQKLTANRDALWIRTPSIVVSSNDEKHEELTGGHNLDAAITYFREGDVAPGDIKIIEEAGHRVILVNKEDLPKLGAPEVLRASAAHMKASEIRSLVVRELKATAAAPIRPMTEALERTPVAVERLAKIEEQPAALPLGWRIKPGLASTIESSVPASRVTVQLHKRNASQYELRFPHASTSTVEINGMASIQDAVSHAVRNMFPDAKEIRVVASNFEPREASNVLESTRIALKGEGVNSREMRILEERASAGQDVLARIAGDGDTARAECTWTLHETHDSAGAPEYQAEFTVEVPSRTSSRSFWVRVRALFAGERPLGAILNELTASIRSIFTSSPAELTFDRASRRITAAIRARAPQAQVNMESFDILVSTNESLKGEREWDVARLDPATVHSSSASR